MLDRLAGPNPPAVVCVDPRRTPVAAARDRAPGAAAGTNVALLNAPAARDHRQRLGRRGYIDAHTVGFDELRRPVADCPPERAADICGVAADEIRAAARLIGTAERLLSTVLQGVYQSHQATAAAVQVNNMHLMRGMLGKPGCGVLQMNGQPTAQNTRECGANGDLAGFRNWANDATSPTWPGCGTSSRASIPHYAPPTHAMQIFRYAEQGSIRMLWISGTNPAVSLPELARIRRSWPRRRLFLVVQDLFLTETAAARRRRAARGDLGREDRHVHQRRPHRAPVRQGRRAARRGAAPTWTSSSTTRGAWTSATRTADRWSHWEDAEVGVRGVEDVQRRPALRLHRPDLRQAARAAAASSGRATQSSPTGPSGSTPTDGSSPHPTTARLRQGPGHRRAGGRPKYRALNPTARR